MTPGFLSALGLQPDCDDRALRRAYAQRLKQIDPASDPHAFQALRDAYEAAQAWLRQRDREHQEAMASPEPATTADVGPEPMPAPEPVEPVDPVFARFLAQVQAGFVEVEQAQGALNEALADDAFINLDARALFEARVGALLMNGWQPGHEFLFPAAAECFQWDRDRARLRVFGRLGVALDAAVGEWQMFVRQPSARSAPQRFLIKDLRKHGMPNEHQLRANAPLVFQLFEHYPNWMPAITSLEQAKRWHAAFEGLPALALPPAPVAIQHRSASSKRFNAGLILGLIMILSAMIKMLDTTQPVEPPASARPISPGTGQEFDTLSVEGLLRISEQLSARPQPAANATGPGGGASAPGEANPDLQR